MRTAALLLGMGLTLASLATAADLPAPPPTAAEINAQWSYKHQSLNGPDALTQLQASNPRHYAIARKILAAANEICDAQKGVPLRMKFDAQNVRCASAFWLTSNPPKRALEFRIDDTVYSALVEVRNLGGKLKSLDARAVP